MNERGTSTHFEEDSAAQRNSPHLVTTARWLFVLLGLTWLVIAVMSIRRLEIASSMVPASILWIFAGLMIANGLLLFWIGWGIGRGNRLYYYFGILLLAVNVLLTFTDEFGTLDIITLVLDIALLVLLIGWRTKFLSK